MKRNTGFTLMEVMIAAALVGLVIITAVSINLAASWLFRSSTSQTASQNEAALMMERIVRDIRRGYDYDILGGPLANGIRIFTEQSLDAYDPGSDPNIMYMLAGSTLFFTPWGGSQQPISTKITDIDFIEVFDPDLNRINIQVQLTAEDQEESTSLDSTATLLYRPVTYPWE